MISSQGDVRTLADRAIAALRQDILSGDLAEGTPVRLLEQVERLNMSSVPIREALRYLERGGLVVRVPHQGVHVAAMSVDDLRDTYAIRMTLEGTAVRLASEHFQAEDKTRLGDVLARYAAFSDLSHPEAREAHTEFHFGLYEKSHSRWLLLVIPMLWDNSERYRLLTLKGNSRGTNEELIAEHRAILDACATGDADQAEEMLRLHLAKTLDTALSSLEQ